MMARTRRNAQRSARRRTPACQTRARRTRAAIAAAVVAGGGTIAVAAMAAGGHGAGPAAAPAAYATRSATEGTVLATALADWNSARPGTYSLLAQLTSARGYSQAAHRGQTLDIQRGIVVLATSRFLILQSAGGALHLWLLSPGTRFQNVSATAAGTAALTASTSATQQAMQTGNMIPATTLLAGQSRDRRQPADADRHGADGVGARGRHRPDRDGHGDAEHRDGGPDRDHPGERQAGPDGEHLHAERMAGRELGRPR